MRKSAKRILKLLRYEGLEERKAEKADEKAAAEQKDQPKKKAARKEEAAE